MFVWLLTFSLGLVIALIVYLRHIRRKNPEQWIRKGLKKNQIPARQIDLWVAVSKVETDSYRSILCTEYFNCFGMTVPKVRPFERTSEIYMASDKNTFSVYRDYPQGVRDLMLWITYENFDTDITDPDDFVNEMKSHGYFTTSPDAYLDALKLYI